MTCPVCGGNSKVCDSISDCEAVYRKRRCLECNHVWFTDEYESHGRDYKKYASDRRQKYRCKRGLLHGRYTEN
ncbi:MAG: hypothetical protein E7398_00165 [Ruminococcaceae bacterium]|nr:hypothetical protein [Oscillospiraceae bacterium]